jgi:hypothetical protein
VGLATRHVADATTPGDGAKLALLLSLEFEVGWPPAVRKPTATPITVTAKAVPTQRRRRRSR